MSKFWQAIVAIGGAFVSASSIAFQLFTTGEFEFNYIVGIGIILFLIFGSWAIIKAYLKKDKQPIENKKEVHGDGIAAETVQDSPVVKADSQGKAAGGDIIETHYHSGDQGVVVTRAAFDIHPSVVKNDDWISVVVPNPIAPEEIECFCILDLLYLDGKKDEERRRFVSSNSSNISLSGGNINGFKKGVARIDKEQIFNIVTPTREGLVFEMAGGPRCLGEEYGCGVGVYKLTLDIRYRAVDELGFRTKYFSVGFVCYKENLKPIDKNSSLEVVRASVDAPIRTHDDDIRSRDYLSVRIIR